MQSRFTPLHIFRDWITENMFVLPVAFGKAHKCMLAHTKSIVESDGHHLSISPRFNKLITALQPAVEKGEGFKTKTINP